MQKIMSIYDVFEAPNRGVVVGGANREFDGLSATEIRKLIGKTVKVHNPNGSVFESEVIEVETSNSVIDRKNIFILLPLSIKPERVELGATVYSQ